MKHSLKVRDITYIALFAVIMAVCSWITIPGPVPFTLQTFAVFMAICVLGGKKGTISVLVYLLMGAIGLPVFSGFSGGLGVMLSSTGGYIIGFLASALVMWGMERLIGRKPVALVSAMVVGLVVCYVFGTAWFMVVYTRGTGPISLWAALLSCVFPFIIPDLLKIALVMVIQGKLASILKGI